MLLFWVKFKLHARSSACLSGVSWQCMLIAVAAAVADEMIEIAGISKKIKCKVQNCSHIVKFVKGCLRIISEYCNKL